MPPYLEVSDDSKDLHRAIAWTDAYYGDGSSLVSMYSVTGKPIMLQNMEVTSQDEFKINPLFAYFCDDGENLWFFSDVYNALFRMDKNTWEAEYVGSFPSEKPFSFALYRKSCIANGKIYFPPYNANEIGVYSIEENVFYKIPYRSKEYKTAFNEAVTYGEYVFFIPYTYPSIMRINTSTNEITYYTDWVEQLKKLIGKPKDAYSILSLVIDNTILLAICGTNAVVEFNMDTGDSNVYKVGSDGNRYRDISFDGESYWFTPRHNTSVVKWNRYTGETHEYNVLIYENKDIQFPFSGGFYHSGYYWLLPIRAKHAIKINIQTDEVSVADEFELSYSSEEEKAVTKYWFSQVIGDSCFAYNEAKTVLVEYNFKSNTRREENIHFSERTIKQIKSFPYIREIKQIKTVYDCCYFENKDIGLESYLYFIVNNDDCLRLKNNDIPKNVIANFNGVSGQAIYNYVKKVIL